MVMSQDNSWYYRANFSQSNWFINQGPSRIEIYPDINANLLLISASNQFYLPLYGTHLSNRIVEGDFYHLVDKSCDEIRDTYRDVLSFDVSKQPLILIDQTNQVVTRCEFKCVLPGNYGCLGFQP